MGDRYAVFTEAVAEFANRREWSQFHTPRNLLLALVGEVGELAAEMQWLPEFDRSTMESDPAKSAHITNELADVFTYLARLADVLGVDLIDAALAKLALNEDRYPEDQSRGRSAKYTEFSEHHGV